MEWTRQTMDQHYHTLVAFLCCLKCHLLWLYMQKDLHQRAFYLKCLQLISFCLGGVEALSFELKNRIIERSWSSTLFVTKYTFINIKKCTCTVYQMNVHVYVWYQNGNIQLKT